ncbi:hypothetical protein MMC29_007325 [Sticta canariensis]|nr:hypothetical protein [Sticta canariensis]
MPGVNRQTQRDVDAPLIKSDGAGLENTNGQVGVLRMAGGNDETGGCPPLMRWRNLRARKASTGSTGLDYVFNLEESLEPETLVPTQVVKKPTAY